MSKLTARFPIFGDTYVGGVLRQFIAELERALALVRIDTTTLQTSVSSGDTYAITGSDNLLVCDTSTDDITVQLPAPSADLVRDKHEVHIKKSSDSNLLYITPTGGATTDFGTDTLIVRNNGTSLHLRAVTGGWRII